jgi:hypothetical protein
MVEIVKSTIMIIREVNFGRQKEIYRTRSVNWIHAIEYVPRSPGYPISP